MFTASQHNISFCKHLHHIVRTKLNTQNWKTTGDLYLSQSHNNRH